MAELIPQTVPPVPSDAYVPVAGDFAFLDRADILTDTNYASLSYWKGVFIHFFKNRRAVTSPRLWSPASRGCTSL